MCVCVCLCVCLCVSLCVCVSVSVLLWSAHGGGLASVSASLFLQELDAVVAVELDGSPVALVADEQRAELQASLTVRLRRNTQLHDVPLQVRLHRHSLRLRPRPLQHAALP